jgi:hypothetical protein
LVDEELFDFATVATWVVAVSNFPAEEGFGVGMVGFGCDLLDEDVVDLERSAQGWG